MSLPSGPYEFLLTMDGVLLNSDVSPSQPFVDVTEVVGLDNAPYRETFRDHEGADGGFLDAEFEKGREIVITGTVYSPTGMMEGFLDQLKRNYAPSQTLLPLYFWTPGVGVRFLLVKPRGCRYNWQQGRRTGQVPIQFGVYAEDPRIYTYPGQVVLSPLLGQVDVGFGFDFGFNIDFGGMGSFQGYSVCYNYGNRPAPILFTIYGPCSQPILINDKGDHRLQASLALTAVDELVLDTLNHTAQLNGTANRRNTIVQDDWFFLEPGPNNIRFLAPGGGAVGDRPILNADASFENGIGGWTANSEAPESSADFALFGLRSLKWLPASIVSGTSARSEFVPVDVGQTYTAAGWVYSPQGFPGVSAAIDWYDASNANIGTSVGNTMPLAPNKWQRFVVTGIAPTSTTQAKIRVPRFTQAGPSVTVYTEMATISEGASPPAFAKVDWNSAWR